MNAAPKAEAMLSYFYYFTIQMVKCQVCLTLADCFSTRQLAFYFVRDVTRSRITQNNSGLVILADAIKEVARIQAMVCLNSMRQWRSGS